MATLLDDVDIVVRISVALCLENIMSLRLNTRCCKKRQEPQQLMRAELGHSCFMS